MARSSEDAPSRPDREGPAKSGPRKKAPHRVPVKHGFPPTAHRPRTRELCGGFFTVAAELSDPTLRQPPWAAGAARARRLTLSLPPGRPAAPRTIFAPFLCPAANSWARVGLEVLLL